MSGMEDAFSTEAMVRRDGWVRADELERELKTARDEIELLNDALKLKTAGEEYAHRLAVMLECALLDRPRTWDDGHALLAEYRAACAMADEPPTFMGEPLLTHNASLTGGYAAQERNRDE